MKKVITNAYLNVLQFNKGVRRSVIKAVAKKTLESKDKQIERLKKDLKVTKEKDAELIANLSEYYQNQINKIRSGEE